MGAASIPVGCLGVGSPTLFAIPNYNLLGLLGILVAATSLILLLMPWENDDELAPWVLLGVAEMLCFASRPTAGALLLVVCLVAIPVAGRWSYRGACMALLSVLVCFLGLAQAVDGHPVRFLARVIEGLNLYQLQTRRTLSTLSPARGPLGHRGMRATSVSLSAWAAHCSFPYWRREGQLQAHAQSW